MAERAAHLVDRVFPDVPVRQCRGPHRAFLARWGGVGPESAVSPEGQVRLELRQPWRDGTTDVVFDPVECLGRLAVLVPRPRINLILYAGAPGAMAV